MTPRRWLAVIIALFVVLSAVNYAILRNNLKQFETLPYVGPTPLIIATPRLDPADTAQLERNLNAGYQKERRVYYWFICTELAVGVLAIGGVWALYFADGRKHTGRGASSIG